MERISDTLAARQDEPVPSTNDIIAVGDTPSFNPMQAEKRLGSAVADVQSGAVESGSIDVIPDEKIVADNDEPDPFLSYTNYALILAFALLKGMISAAATFPVIIFVQRYGLNLVTCTNITVAGSILGVYMVIVVGKLSDGLKGYSYGRRKPFVLFGSLISSAAAIILTFPVEGSSQAFMASQVAIGYFALQLGTSISDLPFQSWLIESSKNEASYQKLTTLIQVVGLLALVLNALLGISGQFFPITIMIAILTVTAVPALVTLVPNPVLKEAPACPPIIPSIRTCVRTKEFVTILINNSAILTGLALGQEFMVITFITSYGLTKMKETQAALAYFGAGIFPATLAGLAFINYLLRKNDKIHLYQLYTVGAWLGALGLAFTLIPALSSYGGSGPSSGLYGAMFITCISFLSFNTGFILIPLVYMQGLFVRDLVVYDNFVNNIDRENVYQVALVTPLNLFTGTVGGLFKAIIFSTGFVQFSTKNENDDFITSQYRWNEGTIYQVFLYEIIIATLMCGFGFYVMRTYPLTNNLMEQMAKVVKRRKEKKAKVFEENETAREAEKTRGMRESLERRDKAEADLERFRNEVDLWNYLSRNEVNHIVASPTVNGKNRGLEEILAKNRIGALIFGPLSMVSLIIGASFQLSSGGQFGTIVITLFNIAAFYTYYEGSRNIQMGTIMNLNEEDLREQARAAKLSNEKYSSSVQNLLDVNKIKEQVEDDASTITSEDAAGRRSSGSSSLSSLVHKKVSIVSPVENLSDLSGYKRQWAVMSCLIIVGIVTTVLSQ